MSEILRSIAIIFTTIRFDMDYAKHRGIGRFQVFIDLLLRELIRRIGDGKVVQICHRQFGINKVFSLWYLEINLIALIGGWLCVTLGLTHATVCTRTGERDFHRACQRRVQPNSSDVGQDIRISPRASQLGRRSPKRCLALDIFLKRLKIPGFLKNPGILTSVESAIAELRVEIEGGAIAQK